ncbi:hypothetical protein Tco_0903882 [Tanacetum coccineum]
MMLPAFVAWLPRLSLSSSVIPIKNVGVLPRSLMLCPLLFLAWSRVVACLVVLRVASQHQHILVLVAWLCLLHLALHLYAAYSLLLNPYMYFFCSLSTSVQTSLLNVYLLLLFVYLCSELSAAVCLNLLSKSGVLSTVCLLSESAVVCMLCSRSSPYLCDYVLCTCLIYSRSSSYLCDYVLCTCLHLSESALICLNLHLFGLHRNEASLTPGLHSGTLRFSFAFQF